MVYMGRLLEPEEMNDIYRKTAHMDTWHRGITLIPNDFKSTKYLLIYR
jgi:hypothetical protein